MSDLVGNLEDRFSRDVSHSYSSGPGDAGEEVLTLLKTVKYDVEEMRLLEPTLLPPDG